MPKMTAKYSSARMTALKESLDINGSQEDLYQRLQKADWFRDSDKKAWWYAPEEDADPAIAMTDDLAEKYRVYTEATE